MSDTTPAERSLHAQVAAHARWARVEDRTAATAVARQLLWQRYLDQVDPDGVLSEAERTRRATSARRADLARLALDRERARRERRVAALFSDGGEAA